MQETNYIAKYLDEQGLLHLEFDNNCSILICQESLCPVLKQVDEHEFLISMAVKLPISCKYDKLEVCDIINAILQLAEFRSRFAVDEKTNENSNQVDKTNNIYLTMRFKDNENLSEMLKDDFWTIIKCRKAYLNS